MADTLDELMADAEGHGVEPRLALSQDEEKALALWDKLQELRLEIAIINAQATHKSDRNGDSAEETSKAQNELLEAQTRYRLRNSAIEAVLTANPILKAVHNGTTASPVERDLLPYVERRDDVAKSVARQATSTGRRCDDLIDIQSQAARASRRNVELTGQLLQLAEELKQKKAVPLDNPEAQQELHRLEGQVKASRQRWRVIKGVASGVVAGSGVDWARDDELRDIVLDPETEE